MHFNITAVNTSCHHIQYISILLLLTQAATTSSTFQYYCYPKIRDRGVLLHSGLPSSPLTLRYVILRLVDPHPTGAHPLICRSSNRFQTSCLSKERLGRVNPNTPPPRFWFLRALMVSAWWSITGRRNQRPCLILIQCRPSSRLLNYL